MTLEISLRPSIFHPRVLKAQKDEPRRDSHWVGQNRKNEQFQKAPEEGRQKEPKRGDQTRYRDLASITLGDVNDAYAHFASQLVPSAREAWVTTNQFCMLPLARAGHRLERPPAVFGRLKTCYPSDGFIHNIEDMELFFPRRDGAPDLVHVRAGDIRLDASPPAQGYYIGVKFLASAEDAADFERSRDLFFDRGFSLVFHSGYIELLEINELYRDSLPWMYVIGSRWFASIPESVQPEIRTALLNLMRWNKVIFNYHPEGLPSATRTLNRELGFKPGFTETFIIEPETPQQAALIVASTFNRIFSEPMG